MRFSILFLIVLITLGSCSSSKLVEQWKNPETPIFQANKVMVIGITANVESRRLFEQKLVSALEKEDIIAVKSIDFFDQSFTSNEKTEKELNKIESQLLDAGFDAVLFSKVTGSESKVTLVNSFKNINNSLSSFRDYFYENQHVYFKEHQPQFYNIYHTETSLYCICPHKERELLWKGSIDIIDPQKTKRAVNDYVKTLLNKLEEQQLLVVE
jgi:hypothetical protein